METIDFTTAHRAHLPYELLDVCSRRIVNEEKGISRVVYDISGRPPADKRHVLLEFGHASPPRAETLRETLAWFDKYLGPVRPQ